MELQFRKIPCQYLKQVAYETKKEEQTLELKLADNMPDIGRVLGAWGQILVRGKECRGNGISVSGGVMAWVLYAPEDGGAPKILEGWLPFQLRWEYPETEKDGVIVVTALPCAVDARASSARKIIVRAGISLQGEVLVSCENQICSPNDLPEDIQVLRRQYPVLLTQEAGEKPFELDEELVLPPSLPQISQIIRCEILPVIQDQKVMADRVVYRGASYGHIVYLDMEDRVNTWDFELPFSQYEDLEREYGPEAVAKILPAVTNLDLETMTDGRLRLKSGIVGQYMIYDRYFVDVVEDAYSLSRNVTLHTQPLMLPKVLDMKSEPIRADVTAEVGNCRIADMSFCLSAPRQLRGLDGHHMEYEGVFQMLYYGENGDLENKTVKWEGNSELSSDTGLEVCARTMRNSWPQCTQLGRDVQLRADITMDLVTTATTGIPMVTCLQLGDLKELPADRPSLIVCRVEPGGLWKTAKENSSTVESIMEANKLQGEPESTQMLLIPIS